MARICEAPIDEDELSKAIKQARALFAYSSESITNQGFWLGFSEMFADGSWYESYLDRLAEVTPKRAWEIAQKYLVDSNRVVGFYRPNSS
jgi:zinc protease